MGFISGADKLQAAQQIKQWSDGANATIDRLISLKSSIETQLNAMKVNADYTPTDITEVQALLTGLNNKISAI